MQAAIINVAHWLECMVTALPTSGSMAELPRWKSRRQPAKMSSGVFCNNSLALIGGLILARRGFAPWARSASISLFEISRNAMSAGMSRTTVTMKTDRGDK
jgi:hypothetical protein